MQDSLLDELVGALTEEGLVNPKSVCEEAMRVYLNTHPTLKLDGAVALWRKERVSLAKAAEIAGLTVPEFNDRQAKTVASALGLPYVDLEEILRVLKTRELLTTEALARVIAEIEEQDHTRIPAKDQILGS